MAISPTYTGQVYDSTSTSTSKTTTKTTGSSSAMGQDAFLKMFMAQMTHQDPLNPMDNTQFTAQLAQFSSLEQLTKINKSLEGISSLPDTLAQAQAVNYLGKNVTFSGNQVVATDDQVSKSSYTLAGAASVKVIVSDSNGRAVYTKDLGQQTAGAHDFQWNGYTDAHQMAPNGTYTLNVIATDSQGNAVKVSDQQVTAKVNGYQKGSDGKGYLLVGNISLPLAKVVAVREASSSARTASNNSTLDSYLSSLNNGNGSSLSSDALNYIKNLLGLTS